MRGMELLPTRCSRCHRPCPAHHGLVFANGLVCYQCLGSKDKPARRSTQRSGTRVYEEHVGG